VLWKSDIFHCRYRLELRLNSECHDQQQVKIEAKDFETRTRLYNSKTEIISFADNSNGFEIKIK